MSAQTITAPFVDVAATARSILASSGGGALCVYHRGVPVIDIWGGDRDPVAGIPWTGDTMAMSFSTTKGVASAAALLLVDRGQLDLDRQVRDYWPEYGTNGKEATTVRHVLAMEAGMYDIRHLIDDPRDMLDHDTMAAALAAAAPAHRPGDANAYHAITYGWLVGELVRRVTGESLGRFVTRELAVPLGLDGCFIGLPEEQRHRVAAFPTIRPEYRSVRALAKLVDPVTRLLGLSPARMAAAFFPKNGHLVIPTDEFLAAEVPSANGVFTARSLARLYAALGSEDGVDGIRPWSATTRILAGTEQNRRRDQVLATRVRWRLGYHSPLPIGRADPQAFGFYGLFGSGAYADPIRQVAVGFVVQESQTAPMLRLRRAVNKAVERVDRNS
ncbi:MAG: serine hydrolase domain-containing protein [Actinomycetota bacterium]